MNLFLIEYTCPGYYNNTSPVYVLADDPGEAQIKVLKSIPESVENRKYTIVRNIKLIASAIEYMADKLIIL
jgi:hypothetical protein